MIVLDGTFGEGGGQILRTSLALSVITGLPFTLQSVRGRRAKPGLQRQHLTAVTSAAAICNATVEGAKLGPTTLVFRPGSVRGGDYTFDIGTAGSTSLVLQTLIPALLHAPGPSCISLKGGTHNPKAPTFEFLQRAYIPALHRMGAHVNLEMRRPGFYPAGGGELTASLTPGPLKPLHLAHRGQLRNIEVRASVSKLPIHIAERECSTIRALSNWPADYVAEQFPTPAIGPGNAFTITTEHEHITEAFVELGERGVLAEKIAERAFHCAQTYLKSNAAVGEHLADQLLLPMALAGEGSFTTLPFTLHTTTNAAVIENFLPVRIELNAPEITIKPSPSGRRTS